VMRSPAPQEQTDAVMRESCLGLLRLAKAELETAMAISDPGRRSWAHASRITYHALSYHILLKSSRFLLVFRSTQLLSGWTLSARNFLPKLFQRLPSKQT